jgi:hypothetical protein
MTDKFTIEDLFSYVCKYIAYPSDEITDDHKRRAILIFCAIDEYVWQYWQDQDDVDNVCINLKDIDFGECAHIMSKKLWGKNESS